MITAKLTSGLPRQFADPLVLAVVIVTLLGSTMVACLAPAHPAANVDPAGCLNAE